MGLDSVELVIRAEQYFDIAIPDQEAAEIVTVQDFADCVYTRVTMNPTEKCKSQILFYRLRNYFIERGLLQKNELTPALKIRDVITKDLKETWAEIETYLRLDLPGLSELDLNPAMEKGIKILGIRFWKRKSPITTGTIGELVNWTLAQNFEKLIAPRSLFDKGDVEKIIIGIVSDSSGIPVDEVKLEHRICYDLGID